MNSTKQKVHVGSQYSKTCLKQSLKKDKTKTNGRLMKVERIAEFCNTFDLHFPLSHNCFLSGCLR